MDSLGVEVFRLLVNAFFVSKYSGFPTLMLFIHGVPIEYTGSRKADQLVRNLKKFVAPDVSILDSDTAIKNFVENAGTSFPMFLGFGLNESLIAEYGRKYKKRAWFAVAKDFSEDIMVAYDFDKVPALVAIHPKYKEQSVSYGPFEGICFPFLVFLTRSFLFLWLV